MFLLLTGWSSGLHAEIQLSCNDFRGLPVKVVNLPSFPDYANARVSRDGKPLMLINYPAVSEWPESVRAFTFLHECGHHVLGHMRHLLASSKVKQELELEADCYSIKALAESGSLSRDDISSIHAFVASLGQHDLNHPHSHIRGDTVDQCLQASW